jgi:hypothetical protein
MNVGSLIPPEERGPSFSDRILEGAWGAGVGALLATVAWYVTGDPKRFHVVPVGGELSFKRPPGSETGRGSTVASRNDRA